MTKNELIAALEKIEGNPEIRLRQNLRMSIPIVRVEEMPTGDYTDSFISYKGPWRSDIRYIQLLQGRDADMMVFI